MRPPRPWPSWRRAISRSIRSRSSSRPAGRPSTIATSPGPCDSPAVVKRNAMPSGYWRGARRGAKRGPSVRVAGLGLFFGPAVARVRDADDLGVDELQDIGLGVGAEPVAEGALLADRQGQVLALVRLLWRAPALAGA